MQFSPYLLLRQPTYALSHLDAFAIKPQLDFVLEDEVEKRRKHFLSFAASKDLLLSLPFSSKAVYNAIPHYEFHASVKIRKKEKQTERALTKYLCRMSLNASPLAAFAKSQFVDWQWNRQVPKNQYCLTLSLAQRKEFFDLCYCDVGLQGLMRYRLNPSLRKTTEDYAYVHHQDGESSIVHLENDEQFESVVKDFKSIAFTFGEFVAKTAYDVNDFLEAQLIIPAYPTYSETDFVNSIIASIKERHDVSFKAEDIIGEHIESLSAAQVIDKQNNWASQLLAYAESLEVGLDNKLYPERYFYLSTYADTSIDKPVINRELLGEEVLKLATLIATCEKGTEKDKLSWKTAYEEFAKSEVNYDLDGLVVNLKAEDTLLLSLDGLVIDPMFNDLGIMLQYTGARLPKLVNVSTAYGKFFGPSLELTNTELYNEVGQWVTKTAKNKVALKDESLHSKNKGNSFVKEMDAFGLDFNTEPSERVSMDILPDGGFINTANGEKISFVNLGIEDVALRSTVLQNLHHASVKLPNVPLFIEALQVKYRFDIQEHISCHPRVMAEHFVLGYKQWICLKEVFVDFVGSIEAHFSILNDWRNSLQIPRIVRYSIDSGKSFYLDFYNIWSLDNFFKSIKKMEMDCKISELGLEEEIKGIQMYEAYFEVSAS